MNFLENRFELGGNDLRAVAVIGIELLSNVTVSPVKLVTQANYTLYQLRTRLAASSPGLVFGVDILVSVKISV